MTGHLQRQYQYVIQIDAGMLKSSRVLTIRMEQDDVEVLYI